MPNLKSHTLISLIFDLLGLKTKYLDSSIGRGNFKRSISYSDQNKKFRDLVNPLLIDGIMGFPISINESIDGHKNLTWHKNMQWYEHSRIAYKTYLDILYPALDATVIHLQKYEDIEKNKNQEEIRMIILISTLLVTVSRAIQEIDNIAPSMSPFKNIKNSIESIIKNDYDVYKASKYELKEISSRTKINISLDIFKKIDKIGGSRNEFPSNEQASKYLEIMQEELSFDEKEKITIENITFELKSKFNSYGFIIRLLKSTEKIGLSGKALVDEIYKTIARIDEKIEKNEYQFSAIDEKNYYFNFKKINGKLDKHIEYFNYLINPRENSNQENLYYPEPFYLCKIDENNKGIVKIHETMNERKVVPIDEIIDIFSKIEFKCNKKDYLLNSLYFIKNNDFNNALAYINKAKKQKEKSMNIISKLISIFYIGLNTCKSTKISPNIFDSEIENLNSKTMQSPLIIYCCNVRNSKSSIEKTKDKINYYDFDENLGRANAIRIYNSFILKSEIKSVKFIANPLEKINKSIKKIIKNLLLGTEKDHITKIIEIEKISLRDISVDYSTIGLDSLAPDALLQYYGLYETKKTPVFSDINEYIFKFFNMPPELKDYTVNQIIAHNKN